MSLAQLAQIFDDRNLTYTTEEDGSLILSNPNGVWGAHEIEYMGEEDGWIKTLIYIPTDEETDIKNCDELCAEITYRYRWRVLVDYYQGAFFLSTFVRAEDVVNGTDRLIMAWNYLYPFLIEVAKTGEWSAEQVTLTLRDPQGNA